MNINKIYQGNALPVLKTFDSESLDMCVTSPPYWGLRAYGTNPQIWDGDENCEHLWGEELLHPTRGNRGQGNDPKYKIRVDSQPTITNTNFCQKCGAWRGELGLEPTFDLYIKHLCDIFDEVKRVLKPTGSCWVNIGTTMQNKNDVMTPERFAIEMTNSNYVLRSDLTKKEREYVLTELVNSGIL